MHIEPALLRIEGEMTIYRAAELKQQIVSLLDQGDVAPAIDLSGVSEIDCSGVQLLLMAQVAAEAAGAGLRLAGLSAAVAEVGRLLNLELLAAASA